MGGVDCKDKSLYHVTCACATRRYWKQIFFNLLDTSISNAYVLYKKTVEPAKPMPRKNFLLELARSLSKSEPQQPGGDIQQAEEHRLEHLRGRHGGFAKSVQVNLDPAKEHPTGVQVAMLEYIKSAIANLNTNGGLLTREGRDLCPVVVVVIPTRLV